MTLSCLFATIILYQTSQFCLFSICLQVGGGSHITPSSSAIKSTTVSTVHAGDLHLAQPSVSNRYDERDAPPWHQSQPLSALQSHNGPSELPGPEREESSLGVGVRKLPSLERVKQPKGEVATSCDLQETDGNQRSRSAVAGRVTWCIFVIIISIFRWKGDAATLTKCEICTQCGLCGWAAFSCAALRRQQSTLIFKDCICIDWCAECSFFIQFNSVLFA